MVQFRKVRRSISRMRAAVSSLDAHLAATAAATASAKRPAAVVSSSAPVTALAAWRAEQERRFDRRGE